MRQMAGDETAASNGNIDPLSDISPIRSLIEHCGAPAL
jgi:hypothetical protein